MYLTFVCHSILRITYIIKKKKEKRLVERSEIYIGVERYTCRRNLCVNIVAYRTDEKSPISTKFSQNDERSPLLPTTPLTTLGEDSFHTVRNAVKIS